MEGEKTFATLELGILNSLFEKKHLNEISEKI